jgi:hypothetical protein
MLAFRTLDFHPSITVMIISKRNREAEHVAQMGGRDKKCTQDNFVGKTECHKPRRIFRHLWQNNIKQDLKYIGHNIME